MEFENFFFKSLYSALNSNNLLLFKDVFDKENFNIIIDRTYELLIDVIKYKNNINFSIINVDQIKIIELFARKFPIDCIYNSIELWIKCKKMLTRIPTLNIELIVLQYLIKWENILRIYGIT